MASRPSELRRERERDLVRATRALFDERGMQDAPIEEIARAVGIARGQIYRHFASKDELFVLTVTDYLAELRELLGVAASSSEDVVGRAERLLEAYAGFCRRYPAFLDVSLSLMHRPARELHDMVGDTTWLRLGQAMAACLGKVTALLREGAEQGVLTVDDPELTANLLWTQVLGAMHLARLGIGVTEQAPGVPGVFRVDAEDVVAACVRSALATLGVHR